MQEDPQTCLAYPSKWNLCTHVRHPSPVRLEHQRTTCLSPAHAACPVSQSRAQTLPPHLRARRFAFRPGKLSVLVLLLALLLGFGLWAALGREAGLAALPFLNHASGKGTSQPPQAGVAVPPTEVLAGSAETPPAALQATVSPAAPAQLPAATATAGKTCGVALEDRIEVGEYLLTLHQVSYGESMDLLATLYDTSLTAIQTVNYFLPSPLWSDLVIVIPVGSAEVSGLPFFEPYFVPIPVASLDEIVPQIPVTGSDLMHYNHLDGTCSAYAGWLLLPHPDRKNP